MQASRVLKPLHASYSIVKTHSIIPFADMEKITFLWCYYRIAVSLKMSVNCTINN